LPILDSVTVRELAKVVEVTYGVWPLEDLLGADEVFIVSATRPALAVHSVDDTNFPAPGDRTKDIQMRLSDHIAATLD
jgi:branched-subunit amino acid aminotransferase/4-amino-4-deoxychorismate lyase